MSKTFEDWLYGNNNILYEDMKPEQWIRYAEQWHKEEQLQELNNKEVLSFVDDYLRNTGKTISEYSSTEECITYFVLDLAKKFGTNHIPDTSKKVDVKKMEDDRPSQNCADITDLIF